MSDDSPEDPHRSATDTDFKFLKSPQWRSVPVDEVFQAQNPEQVPDSDSGPEPDPVAPTSTKKRPFRLRSLLQFRLWLLLLLFVPVAWYFKDYANRPSITYTEEKDLF